MVPPGNILAAAILTAQAEGMTRLADVTGFDRIGLPVFQAVRPLAKALTVSQGKGRSRWQARISACMEMLELAAAEQIVASFMAPPDNMARALWNRHLPARAALPDHAIPWIEGRDLLSGRPCPIPLGLVSMDMTCLQPMQPISTGLAGHRTRAQAIMAALCEIRDRTGLWRFSQMSPLERREAEADPASVAGRDLHWLLARIAHAGAQLRLWQLTPGSCWPVWVAALFDTGGEQMLGPAMGACCRATSAAAAFGAIAEAAQSRVTLLAGARDDITDDDYADVVGRLADVILGALSMRPATRQATPDPHDAAHAGQEQLLRLLADEGAAVVAVADITPGNWQLPFVKAIAPGVPDGERDLP